MQRYLNNWSAVLAGPLAAAATEVTIDDVSALRLTGLGSGDHYLLTLIQRNELGNEVGWEIVRCTARSGSTLTIERAQDGTTANAWPAGSSLAMRLTAGGLNELRETAAQQGVPPGGVAGQVLTKLSAVDRDAGWASPSAGGSGGSPAGVGALLLRRSGLFTPLGLGGYHLSTSTADVTSFGAFVPFMLMRDMSATELAFLVTTADYSTSKARVAIYANSETTDTPGAALYRSSDVAAGAAGQSTANIAADLGAPLQLVAGTLYWAAIWAFPDIRVRAISAASFGAAIGMHINFNTAFPVTYLRRDTSAGFAETYEGTAMGYMVDTNRPLLLIR